MSRLVKIPVNGKAYQNIDPISLHDLSEAVINAYVDESGSTVKIPGLEDWITIAGTSGTPITGLHWWASQSLIIAVRDRRIWKIDSAGTQTEMLGATLSSTTTRVSFADNGTTLIMADGGSMVSTDGATASTITDVDAPTAVTHVAFVDQYILANDVGTGFMLFSEAGDFTDWRALNSVNAEGFPDNVNGLFTAHREILLTGKQSMEFWVNNGVSPWVRLDGGFIPHGVIAPYTVQFVDEINTWLMLDQQRRLVKLSGRTASPVSTPFDKTIQSFTTVADATADIQRVDGRTFYIINFPTENKSYMYDYTLDSWTQTGTWDTEAHPAIFGRYLGNVQAYAQDLGFHLVGSRSDGVIYKSKSSVYLEGTTNIRSLRRTGYVNHDSPFSKRCIKIIIRLKRGVGQSSGADTTMTFRYRDDGGDWSNEHSVSMGKSGETEFIKEVYNLGTYRNRQWEFVSGDATAWNLIDIHEEIEDNSR